MVVGDILTYQSYTTNTPGVNLYQTTLTFVIYLIDPNSAFKNWNKKYSTLDEFVKDNVVWASTADTRDNLGISVMSFNDIADALAAEVVKELMAEKIIVRP